MALGLPNNLNPREVFEQVQLWSQNREHLDLHQLRVLIDNYDDNGLDEPHHPAPPVPPPAAPAVPVPAQVQNKPNQSYSDNLIGLIKHCFTVCQKNESQICFWFKMIAALCITFFFGFLLGIVVCHAWGAIWVQLTGTDSRGGNLPVCANVPPTGNMEQQPPGKFNYNSGDPHLKSDKKSSQSQDGHDNDEKKSEGTCNGDSDGTKYKEEMNTLKAQLTNCKEELERSQFETECQSNFTTCSNKLVSWKALANDTSDKLGYVIEEYNSNNGKEWSQWCIQEWKKQGNPQAPPAFQEDDGCAPSRSAPLESPVVHSRPTASMDFDKMFNDLGTINKQLKESIGIYM